jgi:tetratricopeptide (TPR) repeat protein
MQADYPECEALLNAAEASFHQARFCNREIADVQYGRAAVLLKLQRWDEALTAAHTAEQSYEGERNEPSRLKARFLSGCILNERGDLEAARTVFLSLRRAIEASRNREMAGRLWLCLAGCEMRRREPVAAREWLAKATPLLDELGMKSEIIRADWCRGMVMILEGDRAKGVRRLRGAMNAFDAIGMPGDAGYVGLDLLVSLPPSTPSRERIALARQVANVFLKAGASPGAAEALDHLRRAVVMGQADQAAFVDRLRCFLRRAVAYPNERFEDT